MLLLSRAVSPGHQNDGYGSYYKFPYTLPERIFGYLKNLKNIEYQMKKSAFCSFLFKCLEFNFRDSKGKFYQTGSFNKFLDCLIHMLIRGRVIKNV